MIGSALKARWAGRCGSASFVGSDSSLRKAPASYRGSPKRVDVVSVSLGSAGHDGVNVGAQRDQAGARPPDDAIHLQRPPGMQAADRDDAEAGSVGHGRKDRASSRAVCQQWLMLAAQSPLSLVACSHFLSMAGLGDGCVKVMACRSRRPAMYGSIASGVLSAVVPIPGSSNPPAAA
jgi:hypothetical protein